MKQFLEVGKLNNTHGIKGELKMQLWCDDINYLKQFKTLYFDDNGQKSIDVLSVRPQKNLAIIKLKGIDTIEQAEEIKGKILVDVLNYGSCDIYDTVSSGKHILIPATPDIVKEINTQYQIIKIKAMKGLFDEN